MKNAIVISISNQKGGVAKTTTSQAIITLLSNQNKKILAIDLDAQANLSVAMNADILDKPTMYNLLKNEVTADEVIQKTDSGHILPSNILLSGADNEFTSTGREYILKEAIQSLKCKYDYIVIDCPPALSILTVNAFVASDYIVIPSLADTFSLQGMGQLNETVKRIKKYCNSNLKIAGILLTRYDRRTNLSNYIKETLEDITIKMDTTLFKTSIRNSVSIQEAQLHQKNLLSYDNKSNAINDYISFVKELEVIINGEN